MDSRLSVPMSSGHQQQRSPSSSSVTLTCRTCELRTNHAPGSRLRTICPRCGNFYVSDQLEPGSVERISRVHQRNRSNSRLQSPIMPRRFPSLDNHVRLNDYFTRRYINLRKSSFSNLAVQSGTDHLLLMTLLSLYNFV